MVRDEPRRHRVAGRPAGGAARDQDALGGQGQRAGPGGLLPLRGRARRGPPRLPEPAAAAGAAYYYCQVQGNMRNLGLELCFFVVWTPPGDAGVPLPLRPGVATGVLFPRLREFYFEHYLPAAELHANGRLKPGCTAEEPPEEEEDGW